MSAQIRLVPSRRALLASASGLLLAGCGDILTPPPTPNLYVLKPPMPAPMPGPKVSWALAIERPNATAGLDTERIAITRPPASLDYFADAAWSDRAPFLVQTALLDAFEASGRIAAVARDSESLHADYILVSELRQFEAHYEQPDGPPQAVVSISCSLVAALGRHIVGNFATVQQQATAQNSVDAAVQALGTALGRALPEIVEWTLGAPPVKGGKDGDAS